MELLFLVVVVVLLCFKLKEKLKNLEFKEVKLYFIL